MQVKKTTKVNLSKMIKDIDKIKAKVGFFSSATYEDGTKVAEVAIQNEYGVPQKNQPPRPFMRPAVEDNKTKWGKVFAQYSKKSLKSGNFMTPFEVVADVAVGDVKKAIVDVTTPELAQSTINRRLKGVKGKVNPTTSVKPLIDSGYMLDAVNREVTK